MSSLLRDVFDEDMPLIRDWLDDATLQRYCGLDRRRWTLDETAHWIRNRPTLRLIETDDGDAIGLIGLHGHRTGVVPAFFVVIGDKGRQRKGHATAATREFLQLQFGTGMIETVEFHSTTENAAALAWARHMNFDELPRMEEATDSLLRFRAEKLRFHPPAARGRNLDAGKTHP